MGIFSWFLGAGRRPQRPLSLWSRSPVGRRIHVRRLLCEALEDRHLLSLLATTTALSSSAPSSAYGQPVSFVASVSTDPPGSTAPTGGTVNFVEGSTTLATAPLVAGAAVWTTTSLVAGVHALTAVYGGDGANYLGSSSATGVGQGSIIATVVGAVSYSGDGGPATAAMLNEPSSVAVDRSGNLFIAGEYSCVVREVNPLTQVITTVAGNGISGYSGDNGPATAAELGDVSTIAVDGNGDLFIADAGRVREVNALTHVITTVAGNGTWGYSGDNGPATAAEFSSESAIAVDGRGDLFIADSYNNRVREVNASTGIITTVAGNGTSGFSGDNGPATAAEFSSPRGVAVDGKGDVFIADSDRVREVNAATQIVSTVAGNWVGGFGGDNGPATAAARRARGAGPGRQRRSHHCRLRQQRGPRSQRRDSNHHHRRRQRRTLRRLVYGAGHGREILRSRRNRRGRRRRLVHRRHRQRGDPQGRRRDPYYHDRRRRRRRIPQRRQRPG